MSEEWGPWVEHDGSHKPENGVLAEKVYADGTVLTGLVGMKTWSNYELGCAVYKGQCFASSWLHDEPGRCVPIIRYRIKKPKGLTICESLLANLPEEVDA